MKRITSLQTKTPKRQRKERTFAVVSLVVIVVAWIVGARRTEADLIEGVKKAVPEAYRVERVENGLYKIFNTPTSEVPDKYVAVAEANGYGGPLRLAVAVDLDGSVSSVAIIDHKETPAWINRVYKSDLIDSFTGKIYSDPFQLGEDLDNVTGATYSSRAIAQAALRGSRSVAEYLGMVVPPERSPKIVIGVPEIVLVALYVSGYFAHQRQFKYKKQVRWATLLLGLVILGFVYNKPLTLSMINQALLGYFPEWQSNLYWYLLIGGILFVFSVDNKNPYCEWFCPFGAAQECMGAIGGAKIRSIGKSREFWRWVHRSLTWVAIILALVFRNPGISSYEIFATLFKLIGSGYQFILLGLVLIFSLFVKRPWCNYLCPLQPVEEFIRVMRKWIREIWLSIRSAAIK